MNTPTRTHTSLFLRNDGTLLMVRNGQGIEIGLSPEQLLQLGIDALQVATALQPACLEAACAALENTRVLPMKADPCATIN